MPTVEPQKIEIKTTPAIVPVQPKPIVVQKGQIVTGSGQVGFKGHIGSPTPVYTTKNRSDIVNYKLADTRTQASKDAEKQHLAKRIYEAKTNYGKDKRPIQTLQQILNGLK